MKTIKTKYKSNLLPHIQPIGATFFVTFRLHNSLPQSFIQKIKKEQEETILHLKTTKPIQYRQKIVDTKKRYFKLFDEALDKINNDICFLQNKEIAQETIKQLEKFDFDDEVILKNYTPLYTIVQRIKGASARYSNLLLGRENVSFWQRDYFDYYIRNNEEFQRIIAYILENPVKAKLVIDWETFPYSYVKMIG